ncbi:MAG: DUF3021 family protein, partial [Clostridia bacterium]|nr:DUF3021 family protein [Clostridia bacterium]
WMEHSLAGFLKYLLVFTLIFIVIWILQYFAWKRRIRKLNERMKQM